MPAYAWTCHKCEEANPAGVDVCSSCGFPAVASGLQVRAARGEASPAELEQLKDAEVLAKMRPWQRVVYWVGVVAVLFLFFAFQASPSVEWTLIALGVLAVVMMVAFVVRKRRG